MRLKTVKRTVLPTAMAVAAAVVVALTGPVTPATALVFSSGDAVLVIYGNSNEGYVDLGNWNTVKANGVNLDVSGILNAAGVSGGNTIQYTVVGNFQPSLTPFFFGNNVDISQWSVTQKNQVLPTPYNTALTNWGGVLNPPSGANDPSRQIYASSDPLSFTHFLNALGDNTLAGTIPATRRASSDIDSVLFLLERTGAASSLAGITTAMLNSQTKFFTLSAVPIPAAAVLFATGLIGLVGVARRAKGTRFEG